jgi:hypothetical protein
MKKAARMGLQGERSVGRRRGQGTHGKQKGHVMEDKPVFIFSQVAFHEFWLSRHWVLDTVI